MLTLLVRRCCTLHRYLCTNATASGKLPSVTHSSRDQSDLTSKSLAEAPCSYKATSNERSPISDAKTNAHLTTLSNGLRVASLQRYGTGCTVGVVVSAGPRFQAGFTKGVSHVAEKLAFGPTSQFNSQDELFQELESCGSIFDTQSTKDATIYAVSGNQKCLSRIVNALAQVVVHSQYRDEDVVIAKDKVRFEWDSLESNPNSEPILTDLLHSAAYSANTLGYPKYCPLNNVEKITRDDVLRYVGLYYKPERMVLCGVGVDHDEFVRYAEESFQSEKWSLLTHADKLEPDRSVAQYTGGHLAISKPRHDMHAALGLPEQIHVGIALESCSTNDADFVPACVLHMLMGGGGSFSAGGPGKGMYTRLYTRVLNQYYWANHAQAANHAYNDSGLFTILGSAPPNQAKSMCQVICQEMVAMSKPLPYEEVRRAKKQLQSMLMMNLEMRPIVFEDMGRQILGSGERRPPQYWYDLIEKVEAAQLSDLAHRMLLSRPSYITYGPDVSDAPTLDQIEKWLLQSDVKSKSSFFNLHL